MSRITAIAFTILRIAYGGFFAVVGAIGLVALARGEGNPFTPELTGRARDFQVALENTGFIPPAMLACFIVGGLALIFNRTTPLGVVLLAPFIVVIFLYHAVLTGNWLWGSAWAIGLALIAWRYRKAFYSLVGYRG